MKVCVIQEEEIIRTLEAENTLVLATCAGNRVTARPMSHVHDGITVYFQTGAASLKMRQILENPQVALCVGTLELEGTARVCGHPLAAENAAFAEKYRKKHPGSYHAYSMLEDEVVVCVKLHLARQWRYIDGEPVLAEAVLACEKEKGENNNG